MKNEILTILGIIITIIFFLPFWVNARRNEIKDFIDGKSDKVLKWSFKKFLRKTKYTAKNIDFFLGRVEQRERTERIREKFYKALLEVSVRYIQNSGNIHTLNDRIHVVFERFEKLLKDEDVRKMFLLNERGHLKMTEDVLLEGESYFGYLVQSYIDSGDTEKIQILLYHFGFLSVPETLGLDRARLSYIDKLRISAGEVIET